MENFDRENIDEWLEIRQIRQYLSRSKFCAVQYFKMVFLNIYRCAYKIPFCKSSHIMINYGKSPLTWFPGLTRTGNKQLIIGSLAITYTLYDKMISQICSYECAI